MTKEIKFGFIEKKLERKAPFPLVASDKNAYRLLLDMAKYPEATKLDIYAKRADGEIICDSIDVNETEISYILKQSIYSVPGELTVRLVLSSGEYTVLTAAELYFEVLAGSFEGTPAEDFNTVEDYIIKLSEIEGLIGEIDTALDNIIAVQNSLMGVSE